MTSPLNVLSYAPGPSPAARLPTMRQTDDAVTVIYPMPPRWVPWVVIGGQIVVTIKPAILLVFSIYLWHGLTRSWYVPLSRDVVLLIVLAGFVTSLGAITVWMLLSRQLRWGHVPKSFTMTAEILTFDWLGPGKMRQRRWKVADIRSIELKTHKDMFTRKAYCRLTVRLRKGFFRHVTIRVKDAELAAQIHTALLRMQSQSARRKMDDDAFCLDAYL